MALTVKQGFEKLRQNLEITGLQEETVSTRQQNVREAVEKELTVFDSFLTGSYRRSTMIAPLGESDIDIFVVLSANYYEQNGQGSLLAKVKQVLRKTYTKTPDISPNGQAVTITFTDFKVDVVPAFNRQGGGYLIPDSVGRRWIPTDPKKHVDLWSESNKVHNGNFVPLIKMIKGWNKKHSTLLRSFHLECLVRGILTNVTISDFPSGVRYVFEHGKSKINAAVYDPAGYGSDVGSYGTILSKFAAAGMLDAAYKLAYQAEQLDRGGQTQLAFQYWRKIFDDYCPAYG